MRLVVLPEWQGIGIGSAFLNEVCRLHLEGKGRCGRQYPTYFNTSHPQLCNSLRRQKDGFNAVQHYMDVIRPKILLP